jgi:hypothetical protein
MPPFLRFIIAICSVIALVLGGTIGYTLIALGSDEQIEKLKSFVHHGR